ncbi:MAG: hypothetical protein NC308_07015 [Clostridium sp.]|nr:hypothetical protein [Bacteroides sp.]MCM1198621.1 hypothetical protein [Clostridium sp.]
MIKDRLTGTGPLAVALLCIIALLASGCVPKGTLYCCAEDGNDLVELLEDEGFKIIRSFDVDEILDMAPEGSAVLILNPAYPDSVRLVTSGQASVAAAKKLRIFAEFASFSDTLPVLHEAVLERVVVVDSLAPELRPMDLLTVNRGYYFRESSDGAVMVLASVAGFDTAVYGLDNTPAWPLVHRAGDGMWLSTSQLSNFAKVRFLPEFRWKAFWEYIVGDLLQKEVKFSRWTGFVRPSYTENEPLPKSARISSVRKGVEWFYNGHFLVHPSWKESWLYRYQGDGMMPVGPELPADAPDGDGSLGVLEGHCSAIYADGRQAYRYWLRDDVQGESSMTFAIAGQLLGEEEYKKVAANIAECSFRDFRDGPRDDPQSPSYGLLSWAITPAAKDTYYGDDNARSILGTILSSHIIGESRWDRKITEAIIGNYRTTGLHGFRGDRLLDADLQKYGWKHFRSRDLVNPHPHFESWMWACYLWLYRQTGYGPLLEMCEEAIGLTMDAYPDGWSWTNGIQQEKARMILPLAWLYRVSPTPEHREWLDFMVTEFLRNQVECGAIREELGDASKGLFGRCRSNEAYGKEEAPLIFDNGDPVADMLYTGNFAFFGLNEAACATGDPDMLEAVEKLSDFMTRIQVRSDRFKNVDGAWFRAFNYRNWDYWASNADAGWGAQSTLTGWIQSWIVTTQALMEMETSFWDITSDSCIGKEDMDVIESMLE